MLPEDAGISAPDLDLPAPPSDHTPLRRRLCVKAWRGGLGTLGAPITDDYSTVQTDVATQERNDRLVPKGQKMGGPHGKRNGPEGP
jgi:hypothetical protein